MSEYYTITLYRDDAVVYQGNDWYAVDEVMRIGDRITMPCGVNVTYMGGFEEDSDADPGSDDETSVGSRSESDDEHDDDDDTLHRHRRYHYDDDRHHRHHDHHRDHHRHDRHRHDRHRHDRHHRDRHRDHRVPLLRDVQIPFFC